jgi:hypothetical protein
MTISKHRPEDSKKCSMIKRHGSERSIELLRRSRLGLTAHSAPTDCSATSTGPLKNIEMKIEDALERLTQHTGSEIGPRRRSTSQRATPCDEHERQEHNIDPVKLEAPSCRNTNA